MSEYPVLMQPELVRATIAGKINPKRPWASNPAVYRIEFKVREAHA